MAGITGLACVLAALAQAGSSVAPAVYASADDLSRLAAELELTAAGAGRWLDALGVVQGRGARERLLVVSASGTVVATRDGGASTVLFGTEIEERLAIEGADLVLVHNHPDNAGLSGDDLDQLRRPGVAAVVAVGHDRSLYIAARTARYDRLFFLERQYDTVRSEIRKWLRIESASGVVRPMAAAAHFSHLAALALAKAGIIEYRAALGSAARESFSTARMPFAHVTAAAASALSRGPRP